MSIDDWRANPPLGTDSDRDGDDDPPVAKRARADTDGDPRVAGPLDPLRSSIKGPKRYRDTVCVLRDGHFVCDGVPQVVISSETSSLLEKAGMGQAKIDKQGYPVAYFSSERRSFPIHVLVGRSRDAYSLDYWKLSGCPQTLLDGFSTWHYMHLNSNPLDFNIDNILRGELRVNRAMHMPADPQERSGKFYYSFSFENAVYTTSVETTKSLAFISRVALILQVVPTYMRQFLYDKTIFPSWFVSSTPLPLKLDDFMVIATSRFKHVPPKRSSAPREVTPNGYSFCNPLSIPDLSDALKASHAFNESTDLAVSYTGSKGGKLCFLISKDKFHQFLEEKPSLHLGAGGCILVSYKAVGDIKSSSVPLARLVCGLVKGDKRVGRHGPGGVLDNRNESVQPGSVNSNNRDIDQKRAKSTSSFKGVCWHKQRSKWKSEIRIGPIRLSLGLYTDERVAADIYARAAALAPSLEDKTPEQIRQTIASLRGV